MSTTFLFLVVLGLGAVAWVAARARAVAFRTPGPRAHSLPGYHGWYVALWAVAPALLFLAVWSSVAPGLVTNAMLSSPAAKSLPASPMERDAVLAEVQGLADGSVTAAFNPQSDALLPAYKAAETRYKLLGSVAAILLAFAGGAFAFIRVRPDFRARTRVERVVMASLLIASLIAILTTLGIVASLLFESLRFFSKVSPVEFLFGTTWSPQTAIRADQVGSSGAFGAVPLFWGTVFIGAIIAMIVAIPLGLMSAIYLTQYARPRTRRWMKPILEILAGVPTVVYGYFAALTVAPRVRDFAVAIGISDASSESALAAGLVMGVMIIPFVSSMADDSIAAVPQAMRDGSLAMGATTSETIRKVLVPAALPGVVGGVLLAVSRAIGETMIVVMAAGLAARLTLNPFTSVTTVTTQIVQLLTGDQEFDSPKTLAAFALGLVLFIVTLLLNIVALRVVKKYAKLMNSAETPLVAGSLAQGAEPAARVPTDWKTSVMQGRIRKRYAAERRFRLLGLAAVLISAGFLAFLLITMIGNGATGFAQTQVKLPIDFPRSALMLDPAALRGPGADAALAGADIEGATASAADAAFGPGGARLLSDGAWLAVQQAIKADPAILSGKTAIWVAASTDLDFAAKSNVPPEAEAAYLRLKQAGAVRTRFNPGFLSGADGTDPTIVGIWGAFKGSLLTMLVTILLAFPVGVLSALYLEEYAPRNRWTDLIEVSINNLAAVPSIIFGLLGLAVFLNTLELPRSAPLVGGITLALMTMPVIVIAGRNAIKSVPPSIRDAALGVGASRVQVVFHHVLPLALPGILTGTIIGMARALGETAPLLMIGMRAFISSPPGGITDPATVLPVQIFLWSDEVSRGFVEKTSAAIIVLLVFLMAMNGVAIFLRNKFERSW